MKTLFVISIFSFQLRWLIVNQSTSLQVKGKHIVKIYTVKICIEAKLQVNIDIVKLHLQVNAYCKKILKN